MQDAARTPPFGTATAAALLAGALACLLSPVLPPWPWLALSLGCGFGAWLHRAHWRIVGAFALGFGLAGLHAASTLAQQLPIALESTETTLSGSIIDLPQHQPRRTAFWLRVDGDAKAPSALRGRLLRLAWYDDYDRSAPRRRFQLAAGSRWSMKVKLRAPRGLRNPGGFDSERNALMQRIAATGYVRNPDTARRLQRARGIDAWRERMSRRIARSTPRASTRFVRALALGDTRAIDDDDWEALRADGLTHLIAISGFHVGLVAGFFALFASGAWRCWPRLARRAPRSQAAAVFALAGAVLYAAVAGSSLPTVRTVLMIAVVVLALLSRRALRAADALALAAIAVLLFDPLAILGAGFWLSFAGVAWLVWCLPPVIATATRMHRLREFFSAQGVATLGLLPLSVMLFGQASLAGPIANMVAIPWWSLVVVPLALFGTAIETLHTGWGAPLWQCAAWAFDLSWTVFEPLARSKLALWWLPESAWFALPFALIGAFWLLLPRGVPGKPLALLLWLPLLWPQRDLPREGDAELVMLDVGQGLSMAVRTRHHALLYDMGPAVPDGFDTGERVVVPALRALGIAHLNAAVISHGDNDHAGGYVAVQRMLPPSTTYAPEGVGIAGTRACMAGMSWRWDGVKFRFLHPPRYFPYLDNESSCVLRIETAHGAFLLTGDIGETVEREVVRRDAAGARADVVQIAHHGSAGSSDAMFVAATHARVAVVSTGYGNRFHHPNPDAIARWTRQGTQIFDTRIDGALRIRLDETGPVVEPARRLHPRAWDAVRRQESAAQLSYRSD
ncbi:MAG: DNA internalization-related competence protein ComEC/Rec2 [Luteimonas sp.]